MTIEDLAKRVKQWARFTEEYPEVVQETANVLRHPHFCPKWAVTLGSGLGRLVDEIDVIQVVPYENIKHWPQSTVEGHAGNLVFGFIEDVPIVGLQGRHHYYENGGRENWNQSLIFPVNVLASMGIENYFVTNAAGGLNPQYEVGDMMIITDHISMIPNPLSGLPFTMKKVNGTSTDMFPNMQGAYDPDMTDVLFASASQNSCGASQSEPHKGVYLAVTGPSYETAAECRLFRSWGADAVGMSTTPEVIAARWRGMKCVGLSCITNVISESGENAATHEEVTEVLENSETYRRLSGTVKNFFRSIYL